MPVTWVVESDALVLIFKGDYGTPDILRALKEARPRATGKPLFLDVRESTVTSSAAETQVRLDLMRSFMPPLQSRIAVIAADAARSGVANVMKAQAELAVVEYPDFAGWESERAHL